jgi:tyrosyl-tRNA synthetase
VPPSMAGEDKKVSVIDLLVAAKLVSSGNEARRLIQQGAVSVSGTRIEDVAHRIYVFGTETLVLKAGKRRFAKILFPEPEQG